MAIPPATYVTERLGAVSFNRYKRLLVIRSVDCTG